MTEILVHPITGKEYETREEYVQQLIEHYKRLKAEKFNLDREETLILDAFRGLCSNATGKNILDGESEEAVVILDVNATYEKETGKEHPLRRLLANFPELGEMVRVSYSESGTKISALIKRVTEGRPLAGDNEDLAHALIRCRQVSPAKPKVEIRNKK